MASDFTENVYLPRAMLENTPSRQRGLPAEEESKLRRFGCELIQEAGLLLKMPQVAIATAQVLLQRFYFRASMYELNIKKVAMGSILLASKLEEVQKSLRHVLNVFYHLELLRAKANPVQVLKWEDPKYYELKRDLLDSEREMLKIMGFQVYVEHPHKYLMNYLRFLELDTHKELMQKAWNYANDSLRTDLCVRFKPEIIASGCIYVAARMLGIPMPEEPNPWWALFEASKEQLDEIGWTLNELYRVSAIQAQPAPPPPPAPAEKQESSSSTTTPSRKDNRDSRDSSRRRRSRSRSRSRSPRRARSRSRSRSRSPPHSPIPRRRSRSRSRSRDRFSRRSPSPRRRDGGAPRRDNDRRGDNSHGRRHNDSRDNRQRRDRSRDRGGDRRDRDRSPPRRDSRGGSDRKDR